MDSVVDLLNGAVSLEGQLEGEFVQCLISQAGPVIAGTKPAAIFRYHPCPDVHGGANRVPARVTRCVRSIVDYYCGTLPACGMSLECVDQRPDRVALLAWRDDLVGRLLEDGARREFLASLGHPTDSPIALMASVTADLDAYYASLRCRQGSPAAAAERVAFPHEIGVLLGYPLDDVRGFICHGGREPVRCGQWKVYGSEEESRRVEGLFRWGSRRCRHLVAQGHTLRDLLGDGARNMAKAPARA